MRSKSTPISFRQSKITRWYVHDNANTVGSEQVEQISNQNNIAKDQNQPSIRYIQPKEQLDLKILLIDNHDSYTYNLYQYISTMTIHPIKVIMNDAFSSYDDLLTSLGPNSTSSALEHFDCIILSPGPGQPSHPADMGIVLDIIRRNANVPILGVCLGHQALGYVYGNEVKLSPSGPVHGLTSSVSYNEGSEEESKDGVACQLFRDLPQQFNVVRYHSLVVDFPAEKYDDSEIEPIAWCNGLKETADSSIDNTNICMGLRHKKYPHYGVQFHPESIGTGESGYQLLWNFCAFADKYKQRRGNQMLEARHRTDSVNAQEAVLNGDHPTANEQNEMNDVRIVNTDPSTPSKYRVLIHKVEREDKDALLPLPKQVFEELYSSRPNSFWLDSSTGEAQFNKDDTDLPGEGCPITSNSRFSIMGSNDGPLSRKIEYFGREHDPQRRGLKVVSKLGSEENIMEEDILSYLRLKLFEEREIVDKADMVTFGGSSDQNNAAAQGYTLRTINEFGQASDQVPFDYRGGYVGYLGYEVRHDTQCWIFEQEGGLGCGVSDSMVNGQASSIATNPNVPTAAFLFADQSLLYDHQTGDWYIVGVAENENAHIDTASRINDTISWMHSIQSKIKSIGEKSIANKIVQHPNHQGAEYLAANDVEFVPNRSKAQYQMDIERSHEEIRNGESYELCVTNQLEAELKLPKHPTKASHESPFEFYKLLRESNPAPFSAFMNFYDEGSVRDTSASLSICCSSPERFLSVKKDGLSERQFVLESKPIKGTAARYTGAGNEAEELDSQIATRLQESMKDRAENLMIVDLLRNDLGRVCQVGSVDVPRLMHIESYATVHQLVSTIRGTLDGHKNPIDVITSCFPGGSMTGAPKQRSMEILNEIEQGVSRGPYSGSLGYISLNGCIDMNIVIRSAVLTPSDESNGDVETWKTSIGCGGAITALSNSEDEYEEMLLKSRVVRRTVSEWVARAMAKSDAQNVDNNF